MVKNFNKDFREYLCRERENCTPGVPARGTRFSIEYRETMQGLVDAFYRRQFPSAQDPPAHVPAIILDNPDVHEAVAIQPS